MFRPLLLLILTTVLLTGPVTAQPTNVEILGSLAVKCLGDIPGSVDTFRLRSGKRMPFLRPYLTRHWLARGYKVFVEDSASGGKKPIHELRYDPQSADVTYSRAERDSLTRTVRLSIAHSFVTPEGLLVEESLCRDTLSDTILATDVPLIQQDPWEEAQGIIPLNRGWRTWVEPTVVGASIAIVVYLFFSVRS